MSEKKILFRCDAGLKKEIGTGHLFRSISLAKMLIFSGKIKKKNLIFLIKSKKKYSIAKNIIKKEVFSFKSLNNEIKDYSKEEFNEITKIDFDTVIFDRLGKINNKFIQKLKKLKKKVICFDDKSKNKFLCDLSFNPLIFDKIYNKRNHMSGYDYNILPSELIKTKNKQITKINRVFLSFGGYDNKNLLKRFKKIFSKQKNYKILLPKNNKKSNSSNTSNFYYKMKSSDLVLCAGGLTMFDAINLGKIVIAVDQYYHQKKNINKLKKLGLVEYFNYKKSYNIISVINKINKRDKIIDKIQYNTLFNQTKKNNTVVKKIIKTYEKKY